MPTIVHCDLSGTNTDGDGSTWGTGAGGTNAYQGGTGLVNAMAALGAGDTIYVKKTVTGEGSLIFAGPTTVASRTDPLRVIGVKEGTTNLGASIVQSDLIPGIRTGQTTRAYAWGGETTPKITADATGGSDITTKGNIYMYGLTLQAADNVNIPQGNSGNFSVQYFEECKFVVTQVNDLINIGGADTDERVLRTVNCLFDAGPGNLQLVGSLKLEAFICDYVCTDVGSFLSSEFVGHAKFHGSDLSGCDATLFNISGFRSGIAELRSCKLPASHVLTTGTAVHSYTVANYGSEDSTGLTSTDSEQALQIHTHQGTVDIETTAVRTGGADDKATGGFAWALTANNVTDNFVGVVSPWMYTWVAGDGTAKTLTVFMANDDAESAGNLLKDSQVFLEVGFPSEAGISMYDYLPDEGAPGDGGGRMQLLGTAADITTDGSTWGTGANNKQKLTQSIAPDYQGPLYCRVHFSKSAAPPVLFIDPLPEVA